MSCCIGIRTSIAQDVEDSEQTPAQKIEGMIGDLSTGGVPISPMLKASDLMYDFAEIRQVVLAHDRFHNRDLNLFQRWQRGIVEYSEPELIGLRSTNESAHDEQPSFTGVHITHSVSAADLLKFLQKNRQYFLPGSVRFDRKGKNYIPLEIEETLSAFIQYDDAEIIEFDDEFEAKELVYSIVLNKTSKRITVLFRGSTTANDWRANTALQPVRFPEVFQKMVNDENVKVHGGFADYIFGPTNEGNSKFDQIVHILEQLFAIKDYRNYGVFVTGHSLGAGLASLLAFALSRSDTACLIPKPITVISFASPVTGNDEFFEVFKQQEKDGKLRHIRISNNNDVVTNEIAYKHTGLNMNLRKGKRMDIGHGDVGKKIGGNIKSHDLDEYYNNIFQETNSDILEKNVEELYEEYAADVLKQ